MENKLKVLSVTLVLSMVLALGACGKTETAVSAASGEVAGSVAASEVSVENTETNPWFDEEAYHERLEASGLPYKLNDDGTKPAEWTPEFYEGEEYADCDGVTAGPDGYFLTSTTVYNDDTIDWSKLDDFDMLPEEMLWAMSTADFKRAAPGIEPPTDEDFKRFKEDAQKYLESRGAGEYPIRFSGYIADIIDRPNETPESIRVMFTFMNEQVETVGDIIIWGTFYCLYSVKDYSNQGYCEFREGIDDAYGEGTYASLHEELVGDLIDDARSRTQAESAKS